MSNRLEELVPSLELCKQIPKGAFEDSVLSYFGCKYTDNIIVAPTDIPRPNDDVFRICPAPTLEEILAVLAAGDDVMKSFCPELCHNDLLGGWVAEARNGQIIDHVVYPNHLTGKDKTNPTTAALLVWFQVKGIGE